jgi:hypothetical protein
MVFNAPKDTQEVEEILAGKVIGGHGVVESHGQPTSHEVTAVR